MLLPQKPVFSRQEIATEAEALLFRQKDPKPFPPKSAHRIVLTLAREGRPNSLRSDKVRSLI
jgi:hypothetical protein